MKTIDSIVCLCQCQDEEKTVSFSQVSEYALSLLPLLSFFLTQFLFLFNSVSLSSRHLNQNSFNPLTFQSNWWGWREWTRRWWLKIVLYSFSFRILIFLSYWNERERRRKRENLRQREKKSIRERKGKKKAKEEQLSLSNKIQNPSSINWHNS